MSDHNQNLIKMLQSKQKIFFVLTILVTDLIISCSGSKTNKWRLESLGSFTMSVPDSWRKMDIQGIDSSVDAFITNRGDTMRVDYGQYSDPFDESIPVQPKEIKTFYDSSGFRYPSNMVFSDKPEIDRSQAIFLSQFYMYEDINGLKAKLGFPKKIGNGYCLAYFPPHGKRKSALSMFITCRDSLTQKDVYQVFKSIKFIK